MKLIYDLINDIKEELEGAKHYYRTAIYCKEKHSDISRKLIEIAKAELNHANSIHQLIVDLISQYKAKGKEPSEEMMKIYEPIVKTVDDDYSVEITFMGYEAAE